MARVEIEYKGFLLRRKRISRNTAFHGHMRNWDAKHWVYQIHWTVLKDGKTVGSFLKLSNARKFCRGELKGQTYAPS